MPLTSTTIFCCSVDLHRLINILFRFNSSGTPWNFIAFVDGSPRCQQRTKMTPLEVLIVVLVLAGKSPPRGPQECGCVHLFSWKYSSDAWICNFISAVQRRRGCHQCLLLFQRGTMLVDHHSVSCSCCCASNQQEHFGVRSPYYYFAGSI